LYLLIKLANASGQLPHELFVQTVEVQRLPHTRGGSALIHHGRHMGQEVIIKRIVIGKKTTQDEWRLQVEVSLVENHPYQLTLLYFVQLLRKEVLVWRQLQHPHILKLFGVVTANNREFSMASPRINSDSLAQFVASQKPRMDPQSFRILVKMDHLILRLIFNSCSPKLKDMTNGLAYLHANKVIHGDIKPVWIC
jgi:serine/threonine protein kinase